MMSNMGNRYESHEEESVPDSHLQNPIRPNNRILYVKNIKCPDSSSIPQFIQSIYSNHPMKHIHPNIDSEKLYGLLLSAVYDDEYPILPWVSEHLPPIWSAVLEHIYMHRMDRDHISHPTDGLNNYLLDTTISKLFSVKQSWECIRITMQKMKMRKLTTWHKVTHMPHNQLEDIRISQSYCTLQFFNDNEMWLLDYDQVMMLCDTISARVFTYLYSLLTSDSIAYKVKRSTLTDLYTVFDEALTQWGNKAYNVIKLWEPLIQGLILDEYDPLASAGDYLNTILSDTDEAYKEYATDVINVLRNSSSNAEQLADLFGLNRHWGHPTVSEEEGCTKIRDIVKSRKLTDPRDMMTAKGVFMKHFSIQFISMHGRWPRCDTQELPKNCPLRDVIENNITTVNFYSTRYPLVHWKLLNFCKEFEFDYKTDYTEMCNDRAISPYLYDLPAIYAPELLGYKPTRPVSSRRVLLELLRKNEIDIKGICAAVMRREIPEEWKIVLLSAKEREMKIAPRMFAMFVLEMRLYYNITEANLSKTIFKYFPQQTMTLSERELTKRVLSMATVDGLDTYIPIFMSIDFKSWNIHWQYSSTYQIFNQIDMLFGTPGLYTYSHIFFEQCTVAVSSRYSPPSSLIGVQGHQVYRTKAKFPTCDLLWYNHSGGFEGIRQKGWTIITIILLLIVEMKTGIKSFIIGQGDNQFLKLLIPCTKDNTTLSKSTYIKTHQGAITQELQRFLDVLEEVAEMFRLVIKKEESWFSSNFVNYGKDLLLDGAYLPQGMKKISRVLSDINDLYPTLTAKISSMQTTGLSTAQKSIDPLVPYFICQVETLMMISREVICPLLPNMTYSRADKGWVESDIGMNYILHGSAVLSSVPVLTLIDYLYRGHPDPLTSILTYYLHGSKDCIWCRGLLHWLDNLDFTKGRGDPELLINDPSSVNIDSPPLSAQIFKDVLFKKVQTVTRNVNIKEIFHMNAEKEDNDLYKFLIGFRPIYPRILYEILRQTVTATRLKLISKFSSARTIQGLLKQDEVKVFYGKILSSEKRLFNHWVSMSKTIFCYSRLYSNLKVSCPTQLARKIRDYSWASVLAGGRLEGVTIPHPFHQFSLTIGASHDHKTCTGDPEFILLKTDYTDLYDLFFKRGKYQPYIGHKTQEKQSGKVFQMPDVSRPQKAAERLIQIFQWCLEDTLDMREFISELIQTRTNVPWDVMELAVSLISSGSPTHRLQTPISPAGVLLSSRPTSATHIYISTDTMGRFGKNSANFNMHFQGAILSAITLFSYKALYSPGQSAHNLSHHHFSCRTCEEKLIDIRLHSTCQRPTIHKYSENPLIFTMIKTLPLSTSPNTLTLKMVNDLRPELAVPFMILSKIILNINTTLWGVTQKNKVFSSKISLRVLAGVGLKDIMDYLSLLLYLYFDGDIVAIHDLILFMGSEIWQDFAPLCLTEGILEELFILSGSEYQPQLYTSVTGCSRMLNRALWIRMSDIKGIIKRLSRGMVFYIIPGCGLSKIYRMWSQLIYDASGRLIDIRSTCNSLVFEETVGTNLPSKSAMDTLENTIANAKNSLYARWCWNVLPLRVSKTGPESVAGLSPEIQRRSREVENRGVLRTLKSTWFSQTTFPILLELPEVDRTIEAVDKEFPDDCMECPPRRYDDHIIHQVENMSSSYLKIMQIIAFLQIRELKNAACLADGEGSISKYLTTRYKCDIYFNTLVKCDNLVPHRAVSFIPSECVDVRSKIKSAQLSALLGGDLTCENYMQQFLQTLPKQLDLVTFDAESSAGFKWPQLRQLTQSVLRVCWHSKALVLIFKTYVHSIFQASAIAAIMNTLYQNIFIMTPVFCSNNTYEIYIVGRVWSPVITLDGVGNQQTQIWRAVRPHLRTYQKERIVTCPFFFTYPIWIDLLKIGRRLGFEISWPRHFRRLFGFSFSVDPSKCVLSNLIRVSENLQELIITSVTSSQQTMQAKAVGREGHFMLHKHAAYHTLLDTLLEWMSLALLCEHLLRETTYNHACDKLSAHRLTIYICEYRGVISLVKKITRGERVIYSYNHIFNNLKPDQLKSIWVLWGRYNWHTLCQGSFEDLLEIRPPSS